MKKLLLSSLMAVVAFSAQAITQVFTVTAPAWNNTNLIPFGARINSIVINTGAGGGATNLTYALIDSPTNAPAFGWGPIKQTNSGFTQLSSYLTNITKITTNFTGFTTTNTFTNAVYTYTNALPPYSNDWRRLVVGTVSSNSSLTVLSGPAYTTYGLGFTNNNIGVTMTITVDYDPYL